MTGLKGLLAPDIAEEVLAWTDCLFRVAIFGDSLLLTPGLEMFKIQARQAGFDTASLSVTMELSRQHFVATMSRSLARACAAIVCTLQSHIILLMQAGFERHDDRDHPMLANNPGS